MIDAMRTQDLEEVLAIEAASFPEPWPRTVFERELGAEAAQAGSVARVWRDATGAVLGCMVHRHGVDEVELHQVAVRPDARGRGIAKALVQSLLADARARGERVLLEVRAGNVAARALYASLGFALVGTRKAYYRDNDEDALVLGWSAP
ncbi:MAG: ribosomal protein S18-alanine N-acetyltransferase [Myxococcota bacterium]